MKQFYSKKIKIYSIKYVIFFFILGSCTALIKTSERTSNIKQEATDFSLSIVKLYFSEDCKTFYNLLANSLLKIDGDGILEKNKYGEGIICKALINGTVLNKKKTYKDYLENYKIEIFTKAELEKKINKKLPYYFEDNHLDFFFYGDELKDEKQSSVNFISDDFFIFMIRKENNFWIIKGIIG